MGRLLWRPSQERIEKANITKFISFVNDEHNLEIDSYWSLHRWSIENIPEFWATFWSYIGIKASHHYEQAVDDLTRFPGARWFVGARLNFAENLLKFKDERIALLFRNEAEKTSKVTYRELYESVARLSDSLRKVEVKPGDRVVAYMPNLIETVTAMLATASVGGVWASCGTELGAQAVVDRFGQIEPKVLFVVDGYPYKGKIYNILPNVEKVVKSIPTIRKVVVVPYISDKCNLDSIPNSVLYQDFLSEGRPSRFYFEQVASDHPIYIMFSSGTTGKPKCMVQSVAGVLLNHLKELFLHADLKREDVIFYMTSCSWMMWNWLISSLGIGATVLLYDGHPNHPTPDAMWKLAEEEGITIFGTSATYINLMKSMGIKPKQDYDLSALKEICQTGSPLSAEGFEYVYEAIKDDLHFNSISGGTDINGCFVAGSPTLPVYAGQAQAPALGVKLSAYDEKGNRVFDQMGELVIEAPTPSMPLYFWNDPDNKRYWETYFSFYQNKRVWRHGDFIMIHSATGGITFFGRSDAVLKPSGVRIGTAEIYNIVEGLNEVSDSLAVGQDWKGDQRIILFVKLAKGYTLTDELKSKIKKELREKASPRHVPALIIEVPDIPYTLNLKKVELAVSNIIQGRPVVNRDSLINPQSLDFFERILPELQKES